MTCKAGNCGCVAGVFVGNVEACEACELMEDGQAERIAGQAVALVELVRSRMVSDANLFDALAALNRIVTSHLAMTPPPAKLTTDGRITLLPSAAFVLRMTDAMAKPPEPAIKAEPLTLEFSPFKGGE